MSTFNLSPASQAVAASAPATIVVHWATGGVTGNYTFSDGGRGGAFTPSSLSGSSDGVSFTYKNGSPGTYTITVTGVGGTFDGVSQSVTVIVAASNLPCCVSAFVLAGSQIGDIDTDSKGLAARTHRQAKNTENPVELWFYRDSTWQLFPIQPLTGPDHGLELTQTYKLPYALGFTLPDPDGFYGAENQESPYNYNLSGIFDPLLDEARKICLRVGTHCYANLAAGIVPSSTLAPFGGSIALLTDGVLYNVANSIAGYVNFAPASTAPFVLTVDLGSIQALRHAVIRFASDLLTATCTLPASVQVAVSTNGTDYASWPVRPVGGAGGAPGDWADSPTGQTIEIAFCDLEVSGRYVQFTITPTGSQHILIDELAVYGGSQFQSLGCNVFTGYLGDQIDFTNAGSVDCLAIDVLKKLADNAGNFLTAAYNLTSAGGWELGDIAYSLLNSSAYWRAASDYDTAFTAAEIGWSSGSGLTGLKYPLWQGQTNNILGYCQELFGVVGWNFYADGNGIVQATEPPYTQRTPDRVCIAAPDGNYDVGNCKRQRTGKLMRNDVIVQTGTASKSVGSGMERKEEPNSIRRYGTRTTRITDPLASTDDLRQKVASYFLRDYAWNLQKLSNVIRPQFETKLKQIFGFRAPARPNLYARTSAVSGSRRKQELWSLVGLKHSITYGKWDAQADWVPYVARALDPPDFTALNQIGGHTDELSAVFTAITDPNVIQVRAYASPVSEFVGFAIYAAVLPAATPITLTGLVPGQQYWVYLTTVDQDGNESLPSATLYAIPGSSSQSVTCYTITDYTVDSVATEGPDEQGYYTYTFLTTWTAPACGFTQGSFHAFVGAAPPTDIDNINAWNVHPGNWKWWAPQRIPAGKTWDRVTDGLLDFTLTLRTATALSGLKMYFRIWNSKRTRAWVPAEGNYDFCTVA